MEFKFVTLTPDNLASEHLSCIIRTKKAHPGVEAKRRWLAERLPEGHIFRKLDAKEKETAFIEYAPLETAWVPITGDNYLYLYCLWVTGSYNGLNHWDMVDIFKSYGCTYAYNLDGGGSATLYFNGKVMNKLIGNTQRPCADFLYFTR